MSLFAVRVPHDTEVEAWPLNNAWRAYFDITGLQHSEYYGHRDYMSRTVEQFRANHAQKPDPDEPEETFLLVLSGDHVHGELQVIDSFDMPVGTYPVGLIGYSTRPGDNPGTMYPTIFIAPTYRRCGIGSAALTWVYAMAESLGATILETWASVQPDLTLPTVSARQGGSVPDSPDVQFMRHRGWVLEMVENSSRLDLTDPATVRRVQNRHSQTKNPAVTLEFLTTDISPENARDLADALTAFEADLPRGADSHPQLHTAESVARQFATAQARRTRISCAIARMHGQIIGLSQLIVKENAQIAYQEATWIHRDYRGQGLATFLKTAHALHVIDTLEQVTAIETDNAETNLAMWIVNERMGFVRARMETNWFSYSDGQTWGSSPAT